MSKKLNTYSLQEAVVMLDNKKGIGKSKPTTIHIEYDIEIKTSVTKTYSIVSLISLMREAELRSIEDKADILAYDSKSTVKTDYENNPDWREE
jgi:hypothetical protein